MKSLPQSLKNSVDDFQRQLNGIVPDIHIVLGSGFGSALEEYAPPEIEFSFEKISTMVKSSVPDHLGKFCLYSDPTSKRKILFQLGRLHGYEGHSPLASVLPVLISALSGCRNFILTNAAGGLDPSFKPGDVMILKDHVNLTGQNPLIGPNLKDESGNELGPRFVDMSDVYTQKWRKLFRESLEKQNLTVHEGIYLGLLGPNFETHAEVQLFSKLGMHAVGMSTVWESIILKYLDVQIGGLSLIGNLGAGMINNHKLDHSDIVNTCRNTARSIVNSLWDISSKLLSNPELL